MSMRIYTKTGDKGETGLLGGHRVSKDAGRVEAYGDVDELNAAIGWALSQEVPEPIGPWLHHIQGLLFELGAELASPNSDQSWCQGIDANDIAWLENCIDAMEDQLPPLKSFIMPAGTPVAAALHLCRTVCRRAERRVVTLRHKEPATSLHTVTLLNRLSDFLFVAARAANQVLGVADTPWEPRPSTKKA